MRKIIFNINISGGSSNLYKKIFELFGYKCSKDLIAGQKKEVIVVLDTANHSVGYYNTISKEKTAEYGYVNIHCINLLVTYLVCLRDGLTYTAERGIFNSKNSSTSVIPRYKDTPSNFVSYNPNVDIKLPEAPSAYMDYDMAIVSFTPDSDYILTMNGNRWAEASAPYNNRVYIDMYAIRDVSELLGCSHAELLSAMTDKSIYPQILSYMKGDRDVLPEDSTDSSLIGIEGTYKLLNGEYLVSYVVLRDRKTGDHFAIGINNLCSIADLSPKLFEKTAKAMSTETLAIGYDMIAALRASTSCNSQSDGVDIEFGMVIPENILNCKMAYYDLFTKSYLDEPECSDCISIDKDDEPRGIQFQ